MFTRWNELERTFAAMDDFRRRMDLAFDVWNGGDPGAGPFAELDVGYEARAFSVYDEGTQFILRGELPGVAREDVQITLTQDVLTVRGTRKLKAPEGYSVHRQERRPFTFARSFTLPQRINAEAIEAKIDEGVLTVVLPKVPEAQPRQITVKAG